MFAILAIKRWLLSIPEYVGSFLLSTQAIVVHLNRPLH